MTIQDITVRVGIKTLGKPELAAEGDVTVLRNMLIGDGFHWQQTIEARLPGKTEPYADPESNVSLVNVVPVETYLECVVGSEMNPAAPLEFLKAHAVISRSWAVGKVLGAHRYPSGGRIDRTDALTGWDDNESHKGYDVCSDDHCQRYQGLQPISETALRAIRETAGEVLTDSGGNIVDARFSKCCGGKTEVFSTCWQPVEVATLESFDDPWCDLSELRDDDRERLLSAILKDYDRHTQNYGYRWEEEISYSAIQSNLKKRFGRDIGRIRCLTPLHRGPSGRIDLLEIEGERGRLRIGKELWIRRLLSQTHLYSSAFEIEERGNDAVRLRGRGWGHGVGLCQIGAAHMARRGHSYRDILAFYYPSSRCERI